MAKRIARLVGGWTLIVLGVLGCVLPIAPGIPLVLAGLALLAVDYPWAKRWLDWGKERLSRLRRGRGKKAKSAEAPQASDGRP